MKGPPPKPAHLRQRKNRTSTAAVLRAEGEGRKRAPSLPKDREWHSMTLAWWRDVWHSPMAAQFVKADAHGLYRLAVLVDRFWLEPTTTLAGEIRQQQAAYGLTPLDRRRLQWESAKAEAAEKKRRPLAPPSEGDPRNLLRMVAR